MGISAVLVGIWAAVKGRGAAIAMARRCGKCIWMAGRGGDWGNTDG